ILACTNEGDLVLDPFAGSGTTCVVAAKLNRRYIGIDISEKYVTEATRRIASTLQQYPSAKRDNKQLACQKADAGQTK
ncbi:MAG: site-specific DNA-methyltransferase, partial [Planctomycetes bacterium]|nr:site-specific DNA-methyltransferase [Planctomycetota bacterium]